MHCGLFQRLESSRHLVLIAKHKNYLMFLLHILGWSVLQLPTHCSFRVGRSCALWAPSLPQTSKKKSHFLLPLQCMAPGMSGLHGACALPPVGEATGTGPAPANHPSSGGTPARAPRNKPSSATSPSAQVGTVTDLNPPLQQVPQLSVPHVAHQGLWLTPVKFWTAPGRILREGFVEETTQNCFLGLFSWEMPQVQVCPVWSLAEDTLHRLDLAATAISKTI